MNEIDLPKDTNLPYPEEPDTYLPEEWPEEPDYSGATPGPR